MTLRKQIYYNLDGFRDRLEISILCVLFIIVFLMNVLNDSPKPTEYSSQYSQVTAKVYDFSNVKKIVSGIISNIQYVTNTHERISIISTDKNEIENVSLPILSYNNIGYVDVQALNIRNEPNENSDILGVLLFNEEITYSIYNDNWVAIEYNNSIAYIYKRYISDEISVDYITKNVVNDVRKSYMDYTCITSKSSDQYKLQQIAYTEENGIRAVNGRYCIALGQYYTHNVGQYVDLVLENGVVIPCIIGDCKANVDTDPELHAVGNDGGVAEFIVETDQLADDVTRMGDVSFSDDDWSSNVKEIRIYCENIFDS